MGRAERGDGLILEGDRGLKGGGKTLGEHKNVLMVAHAASVIALVRVLTGEWDMPLRVGCCSLSLLVPMRDGLSSNEPSASNSLIQGNTRPGAWSLFLPADASFLPNGSERDWGFADIEVAHGEVVHDNGEGGADRSGHELETKGEGEAKTIGENESETDGGLGSHMARWFPQEVKEWLESDVRRYEADFQQWGREKDAAGSKL